MGYSVNGSLYSVNGSRYSVNGSLYYVNGQQGGGGGGWPSDLNDGMFYRYDASVPETVVLGAGSEVVGWVDLGTQGLNLSRVAQGTGVSPVYEAEALGGGPCVSFDWNGSKLRRICGVPYGRGAALTVGIVYEAHPALWGGALSHYDDANVGVSVGDDLGGTGAARTHSNNDPPGATFNTVRTPQVLVATLGPSSSIRRNGVDVTTSASNGAPVDCGPTGTLCVGGDTRFIFNTHRVGLVVAWDSALDASRTAAFLAYCASRWPG